MRKRNNRSMFGAAVALLLVVLAFFFVRLGAHRPPAVALPKSDPGEHGGEARQEGTDAVRRVEVTPETVQLVIERLARPDTYRRTVSVERFWTGGSGVSAVQVRAAGGWTRADVSIGGGDVRHSVTGGGESWIWYGGGRRVFTGAAALTADEEQSIPTYEDILRLDTADIAAADYRTLETVNCIYVETAPDAEGGSERFWIAVDSGLLVASERWRGETLVYRMTGLAVERRGVTAEAFTLPDGTVLFDPDAEAEDAEETITGSL